MSQENESSDVLACLDVQRETIAAEGALRSTQIVGQTVVTDPATLTSFSSLNSTFQSKIRWVLGGGVFKGMREVSGDGNCFLRSFLFHILEGVGRDAAAGGTSGKRLLEFIAATKAPLLAQFGDYVEDFVEVTEEIVQEIIDIAGKPSASSVLMSAVTEQGKADYLLYFLRMAQSWFLRSHAAAFAPFISGTDMDTLSPTAQTKILNAIADGSDQGIVDAFCESQVEPVGVDSDQFHILSLCALFNVRVDVVYLDNNVLETVPIGEQTGMKCMVHSFDASTVVGMAGELGGVLQSPLFPQLEGADATPDVAVLYRPGHYEILCLR